MASLEQLTIDIHMKATEDAEKFVFEIVSPYVNDQLKMTITKQELLDTFRAKEKLDNLKELLQNMAHFNGQVKAEFLLGMLEKEDEKRNLQVGDTIQCRDREEMLHYMYALQDDGIETEFLYEKNGVKGLWLEITKVQ